MTAATFRLAAAVALALLAPAAARATELGAYRGAGCTGVEQRATFERWFGRLPDRMLDFIDNASWQAMTDSAGWTSWCWRKAGARVVFSLPMLPKTPGASLADGAAGRYDEHFRTVAAKLVANGHGDAIVRIGWEFNGDWYPWRADKDPAAWVAYWRRIAGALRAAPGASFRFDWCPAMGRQRIEPDRLYPGDDVVDIVGLDVYNESWGPPKTPEARWQHLMHMPYGLKWQRDFAAAHGKPTSFPEWGTGVRPGNPGSGGDDALFIARMAEWIGAARPAVVYHAYWDYPAPDFNAMLSDGHQPAAGAEFLARFRAAAAR